MYNGLMVHHRSRCVLSSHSSSSSWDASRSQLSEEASVSIHKSSLIKSFGPHDWWCTLNHFRWLWCAASHRGAIFRVRSGSINWFGCSLARHRRKKRSRVWAILLTKLGNFRAEKNYSFSWSLARILWLPTKSPSCKSSIFLRWRTNERKKANTIYHCANRRLLMMGPSEAPNHESRPANNAETIRASHETMPKVETMWSLPPSTPERGRSDLFSRSKPRKPWKPA